MLSAMSDQKVLPECTSKPAEDFSSPEESSRNPTDSQAVSPPNINQNQHDEFNCDPAHTILKEADGPCGLSRSTKKRMKRKLVAHRKWDCTRQRLNSIIHQSDSTNESRNDCFREFTVKQCLLAIAVYVIFGVISYSYIFEDMHIVDSLYFTVVTFTTVGYGDVTPSTVSGKIFTCFFATIGVGFIGVALGLLITDAIDIEENMIEKLGRIADKIHIESHISHLQLDVDDEAENASSMAFENLTSNQDDLSSIMTEKSRKLFWKEFFHLCLVRFLPTFLLLFIATMIFVWTEDWEWNDSLYYLFTTSTTVGYGDVVPVHPKTKIYTIFFIIIAVGVMADMLGRIAQLIISRRRLDHLYQLESRKFRLKDLKEMDADGDGQVSELDYIQYMLLALGKVDKELMSHLHKQFCKLDTNDHGSVSIDDIKRINEEHRNVSLVPINSV